MEEESARLAARQGEASTLLDRLALRQREAVVTSTSLVLHRGMSMGDQENPPLTCSRLLTAAPRVCAMYEVSELLDRLALDGLGIEGRLGALEQHRAEVVKQHIYIYIYIYV